MRDRQRERVVAAAGTALPHDETDADADKHTAEYRRDQRTVRQVRQHWREQLPDFIEKRHKECRNDGDLDKSSAQETECQQIAGNIQNRGDVGRRQFQPVLCEEHQADHAALGDVCALVDIVNAE